MSTGPLENDRPGRPRPPIDLAPSPVPPIDLTKSPGPPIDLAKPSVPDQHLDLAERPRGETAPAPSDDPGERADPPARTRPTQAGPAWLVIPARVIAVVIVLPLRLLYDLGALIVRGAGAGLRGLMRTPLWVGRLLRSVYMTLLHPVVRVIGQGAAALWSGIVWLWTNGVYGPVHWLLETVLLGGLRLFGRGTGRLARRLYSIFLAPIVRLLGAIGSVLGTGLRKLGTGFAWLGSVLGTGLRAVCAGFVWLASIVMRALDVIIVRPVTAVCRGALWALRQTGLGLLLVAKGIGTGLMFLLGMLVIMPATALWRYVLQPPLLGLAWLARGTGSALARGWRMLATGTVAFWAIFAGALVWAWRMLGRLLSWLARILFVLPALALYRYLLRPVGQGVAGTWRLSARGLRRLWRHMVVAPARAVKARVFVPIGNGARAAWHVSVREPARWIRLTVLTPIRETGREMRLSVRRAFRGS